jgi:hypothetical protein
MKNEILFKSKYRHIYIVDTLEIWLELKNEYDSKVDLVLTYDFALKKYIHSKDGEVYYLDHLVEQEEMHENNFVVYEFFEKWNLDEFGNDLFVYKGVPFGFSFRLEFWNDYVSFMRVFLSLSKLSVIEYEALNLATRDSNIIDALSFLKFKYSEACSGIDQQDGFYFPIHKWMDEQIRPSKIRGFLYRARSVVTALYGSFNLLSNRAFGRNKKFTVFLQEYHPTKEILNSLRADPDVELLLCNFSRGSGLKEKIQESLLPIYNLKRYDDECLNIIENYREGKSCKLIVNGHDLSSLAYEIVENRVFSSLSRTVSTLSSCIKYLEKKNVDLEILIANIGFTATLFDCVCKARGVPSFLIINGLLGPDYSDDSKYADFINSYSVSVRDNYFKGMDNIFPLGDPRMDMYSVTDKKTIDRNCPTVVIGASGFNSVDLNSFVAVEFEFLSAVLSSLQQVKDSGQPLKVIIKVRPNGYRSQYEQFVAKYYPTLVDEIVDSIPMRDVLERADFYISIYSQTLFEASCLGVPVVYYRADNEIIHPPFDMSSELVTVTSEKDLVQALFDFVNGDCRYDAFLDRKIMEKYVGPLDGDNLERNIKFIYNLLNKGCSDAERIH